MRKSKSRVFVWVYMGILCCVIAVGICLCVGMSGAKGLNIASQQANVKSAIEVEIFDVEVPLGDGVADN